MKYETAVLTGEIRKKLGGTFTEVSNGFTHYELKGPESGELVILIHGFSTPMFVWDPTYWVLVDEGFRVLRYDLFGRGYSDRPKEQYDQNIYIKQLHELIQKLQLENQKASLVGLSMGGIISVLFALKYPEFVKRITLVDPAGFPIKINQPFVLKIPILKDITYKLIGHKAMIARTPNNFYRPENFPRYVGKFTLQFKYKGYLRAIMSTLNNMRVSEYEYAYKELNSKNIPVQLFWGEQDKTIPYSTNEKVRAIIPKIKFHSIPEAGHLSHYERPDKVNPLLIRFLKS